ncbi:MAG: hypothetical protein ACYDB7_12970 [Mycobacteriales bacterium]
MATALALLSLAACGSTAVPSVADQAAGGGGLAVPAGAATGAVPGGSSGASAATAEVGSGGVAAPSAGSGGALPEAGGGVPAGQMGGAGSLAGPAAVPGVTASTISLGALYTPSSVSSQENTALGAAGITYGNTDQDWGAVLADINAHGGVAGRRVVPVFYTTSSSSTETVDQQEQAACADWTQDHHVYVVAASGMDATGLGCLFEHGVSGAMDPDISPDTLQTYAAFPKYVAIANVALDRLAADEVATLRSQGYFGPHATVGVLTVDTAPFSYMLDHALLPALARAGYPHPVVAQVAYPDNSQDIGEMSAGVSSAEFSFFAHHVDHVLIFDVAGYLTLEFLNDAESQHYYPRYGFNSENGAQALLSGGYIPADQVKTALGIGWLPLLDVPFTQLPADSALQHCVALYRAHGITFSSATAELAGAEICEWAWFFRAAMAAGGPNLTTSTFVTGVDRLAGSYPSVLTFATHFSQGQHDGVAAARTFAFAGSCSCFQYTSAPLGLP